MHLVAVVNIARRWRIAVAAGNERRAAGFAVALREIAATAPSSPPPSASRARTSPAPAPPPRARDSGWRIDGRKIFCTMSPAATVLYTSVTFHDDEGVERYGYAFVPADAPGLTVHDDWDALGMRASGSHSVTFDGVELPAAALRGGFPVGDANGYMERNLTAGLFHASASLGIAEARRGGGRRTARRAAATRRASTQARWPRTRSSSSPPGHARACGLADRRARPGRARRAVRRGPGGEDVRQRDRRPDRRPRAHPRRRRAATSTATRSRAPTATCAPAPS